MCHCQGLHVSPLFGRGQGKLTEREPSADERAGMDWWNLLPESGRAAWLAKAQSAKPSDAWATYKRTKNAPEGYGQPSPEF